MTHSSMLCDKQDLEEFKNVLLTNAIEDAKFYSLARKRHVFQLPCHTMQSHREISSNTFHEKVPPCNIGLG